MLLSMLSVSMCLNGKFADLENEALHPLSQSFQYHLLPGVSRWTSFRHASVVQKHFPISVKLVKLHQPQPALSLDEMISQSPPKKGN